MVEGVEGGDRALGRVDDGLLTSEGTDSVVTIKYKIVTRISYNLHLIEKPCQVKSINHEQFDTLEFWEVCTDKLVNVPFVDIQGFCLPRTFLEQDLVMLCYSKVEFIRE